jgi:translation initiation factor eIF-2B subunit beta
MQIPCSDSKAAIRSLFLTRSAQMDCDPRVEKFVVQLRRQRIVGSRVVALATAKLLLDLIQTHCGSSGSQLIVSLKVLGKKLVAASGPELCVGNIVRRVLFFVRDELSKIRKTHHVSAPSLSTLMDNTPTDDRADTSLQRPNSGDQPLPLTFKKSLVESIEVLRDEIETIDSQIEVQAIEHIHSDEVILTLGHSTTIENFLAVAARKREFHVLVADGAPAFNGHKMALALSKMKDAEKVTTTVITDAAVFAVMARCNKVIIGCNAVLANGGILADAGALMLAQAAKEHSVPVVVCAGSFKLCPEFPHNEDSFNSLKSPNEVLPSDIHVIRDQVQVVNPAVDYVPPNLVSLLVTNFGGHLPSYVYRLLSDQYAPEDSILNGSDE